MSYCAYVRRSRLDYEAERVSHEDTLARQRAILTDLAAANRHVISEYYEEVVSGDTIQDRPRCQQLIADLIAGKWEGVYCTNISRLARGDTSDQGTILRVLQLTGAKVITPEKTLDPANADDQFMAEVSLFLARQEYKSSTRRQQAGKDRSLEEGKCIASKAAYGYRRVKLTGQRGWSLEIQPEEAVIVQSVASWYLYGRNGAPMGITAIATHLTDTGVFPGENGTRWTACRIHRMLTNPVYAGWIRYGYEKVEKTPTLSGYSKRRVINNDCKLRKGIHQAILPQATFDAIQQKLHGYNKHLPVRKGAPLSNPLAGLVFCAECGHVMSHLPEHGRQGPIIKCRTRGCPTVQSYREPVEQAVLAALRRWLDDPGALSLFSSPQAEQEASALPAMEAELDKLRRQLDRVQDLFEQDVYSLEDYQSRRSKLDSRMQELKTSIAAEKQLIADRPVYATHQELAPAILRLFDGYENATPQQKNDMLKSCISSVVYRKSKQGTVIRGHVYSDPNSFELDVYPLLKKE